MIPVINRDQTELANNMSHSAARAKETSLFDAMTSLSLADISKDVLPRGTDCLIDRLIQVQHNQIINCLSEENGILDQVQGRLTQRRERLSQLEEMVISDPKAARKIFSDLIHRKVNTLTTHTQM